MMIQDITMPDMIEMDMIVKAMMPRVLTVQGIAGQAIIGMVKIERDSTIDFMT